MKLHALAERTHVNPGTLARSLLTTALEEAAPDPSSIVELLDAIPGAYERAKRGLREAREFPESGQELTSRWQGFRYMPGPWRWMLIVFAYDSGADQIYVVTIQDSRTAESVKSA